MEHLMLEGVRTGNIHLLSNANRSALASCVIGTLANNDPLRQVQNQTIAQITNRPKSCSPLPKWKSRRSVTIWPSDQLHIFVRSSKKHRGVSPFLSKEKPFPGIGIDASQKIPTVKPGHQPDIQRL